jgi:hypothetical protein
MASNAFVVWSECDRPWLVEEQLISATHLPLNLDQNERHPFFPVLSESRRLAKNKAREMSIWNELV